MHTYLTPTPASMLRRQVKLPELDSASEGMLSNALGSCRSDAESEDLNFYAHSDGL